MKRPFALALAVAMIAAAPHGAPKAHAAAKPSPSPSPSAKIGRWTLVTSELDANLQTGAFSAPNHVTMTRADGSVIQADRAAGNYKQHQARLYGNVSVHDASGTFGLKSAQGTQAASRGPATLTADELFVDDKTQLYDAKGHVRYEQGDTKADAQSAHLNDATHVLNLAGHVHVVQGDRTLDAQSATYNTQTGFGQADNQVVITFPGVTPSIATPKPIKAPAIP